MSVPVCVSRVSSHPFLSMAYFDLLLLGCPRHHMPLYMILTPQAIASIRHYMEGAWTMAVPLTVKIQIGKSWGYMEEYLPPTEQ